MAWLACSRASGRTDLLKSIVPIIALLGVQSAPEVVEQIKALCAAAADEGVTDTTTLTQNEDGSWHFSNVRDEELAGRAFRHVVSFNLDQIEFGYMHSAYSLRVSCKRNESRLNRCILEGRGLYDDREPQETVAASIECGLAPDIRELLTQLQTDPQPLDD